MKRCHRCDAEIATGSRYPVMTIGVMGSEVPFCWGCFHAWMQHKELTEFLVTKVV